MIIQKSNPTGVDVVISELQLVMYNWLVNNSMWTFYNCYERVYKNPKTKNENSLIPEVYIGNGEYKEIYMDDNSNVESFFIVNDIRDSLYTGAYEVDVGVVFQISRLNQLYPSVLHRADEEAHRSTYLAINQFFNQSDNIKYINLVTTIDDVYDGLDTSQLSLDDMHPYHVFRHNLKLTYYYNCYE